MKPIKFKIGMAGYTYHSFTIDQTLADMEKYGSYGDRPCKLSSNHEGPVLAGGGIIA